MAVAAALLAFLVLALWLQTQAADVEVQSLGSAAAAEPVAAEPVPDMRDLVTELDLWSEGIIDSIDPTSVSLHYYDTPSPGPLARLLGELDFSPEVVDRIVTTQALDGTLTATAPHASASWSYEPDEGLSVVIAITD